MRLFFRPKTDSVSDPFFYRKKVVFIPQDPLRTPPGPSWGALGARRWILLDLLMILGSQMGPQNFPGGPRDPPKSKKKRGTSESDGGRGRRRQAEIYDGRHLSSFPVWGGFGTPLVDVGSILGPFPVPFWTLFPRSAKVHHTW